MVAIKFSPNILYHLGLSMYRNPYKAISELIVNSYDADADWVKILTFLDDENPRIVIEDNGIGMTEEDVKDFYLYLGYNSRNKHGDVTEKGRKRIGTKGIGKLAGLGISEKMIVEMRQDNKQSSLVLDLVELLNTEDLTNEDIPITTTKTKEKDGCTITLANLTNKGKKISPQKLREYIARNFTPKEEFNVFIDGKVCSKKEITEKVFKIKEKIPGLGPVSGYFAYLDRVPHEPGVMVKVSDRTVTGPRLYGFHRQSGGYFTATHLFGEINADFLDEAINTSRDGFDTENEKWIQFQEWIEKELKKLVDKLRYEIIEKRIIRFKELPLIKETINVYYKEFEYDETKVMLEKNIERFIKAFDDMDEKTAYELTEIIVKFFQAAALRELFTEMTKLDVDETEAFSKLLREYGLQKISFYIQGIQEWLHIIEKFQEFINSDTSQEMDIHKILADNLWIIDEELHLRGNNISIKRVLEIIKNAGEVMGYLEEKGRKRPDIVSTNDGLVTISGIPTRRLKVIELKKPTVTIARKDINQTMEYLTTIKKNLGGEYDEYKAYLIGGQLSNNIDQSLESSKSFEIVLFNQLLDRCERRYQFLLGKFEEK